MRRTVAAVASLALIRAALLGVTQPSELPGPAAGYDWSALPRNMWVKLPAIGAAPAKQA